MVISSRLKRSLWFLMGIGLCGVSIAKDIGHYGQVFPVIEEDIRHYIMSRFRYLEQSGELAQHQHEIEKRVSEHVVRPTPINLSTTHSPNTFHVDPTIIVSQDVYTPVGVLVAKKGMQLNPFEYVSFKKTLFFFDGDDAHQVAWARTHYKDYQHVKFILTGGDIRQASELFGRVYFDVGGRLTNLLHIAHVPSVVNQEGQLWAVKEIGANDA